jgi:hypothetical protein
LVLGDENRCLPHSLSFGSGLFSGILHDKTATPYNYFNKSKVKYAYAIKLNKKDFFCGATKAFDPQRLFFLPPLPTIVQLAGIGEFFHPRTKVYIEPSLQTSTELFVSGILNCSAARLPEFLLTDRESVENYSDFVKEYILLIKP